MTEGQFVSVQLLYQRKVAFNISSIQMKFSDFLCCLSLGDLSLHLGFRHRNVPNVKKSAVKDLKH